MLAEENGGTITSLEVKQLLMGALPQRASSNLLDKLARLGYLEKDRHNYLLTNLGRVSAKSKAIWEGEPGVYRLLMCDLEMLNSPLVYIERDTVRGKDRLLNFVDGKENKYRGDVISQLDNASIKLKSGEIFISNIHNEHLEYQSVTLKLRLEFNNSRCSLELFNDNERLLFSQMLDNVDHENDIKSSLLNASPIYEYDMENGAVLLPFEQGDKTEILRSVIVRNCYVFDEAFNEVKLTGIKHQPSTEDDAQRWYEELLYEGTNKYIFSDQEFDLFQANCKKEIDIHKSIAIQTRSSFIAFVEKRNDFYKLAKLQTIDYLIF